MNGFGQLSVTALPGKNLYPGGEAMFRESRGHQRGPRALRGWVAGGPGPGDMPVLLGGVGVLGSLSTGTIWGRAAYHGLRLACHTPFYPADHCRPWDWLLRSQTVWEGHAPSALAFISPRRLGGSETDQIPGPCGLRSDSGVTCRDLTWGFVTYADFLPQLPSQPSRTLSFNKRPGDIFEVEDDGRE